MRREISTARPVSSAASRTAASCTVSPTSTKPPGSAHCPPNGSLPRRIKTTPSSAGMTTSTISFGVSGPAKILTSRTFDDQPGANYTRPRGASPPGIRYALRSGRYRQVKVLCISDKVESMLHGPNLTSYAGDVEAVISCGDLPFDYLEYIVTFLGVPVYYVLGNHDPGPDGPEYPGGCTPLDGRVVQTEEGVVLAGLSGSPLYSGGPNQYTEGQVRCRGLFGRPKPRIFVTHSPPFGLGDAEDVAHIGFRSFVDLIDRHQPRLW